MSNNFYNLCKAVINKSVSKTWESAVKEWEIYDVIEDNSLTESCICGKENLKYLFTIHNINNDEILFPIGSSCIKKFEVSSLYEEAKLREQLFKLLHAIENHEFITLKSSLFSRKLLSYLYNIGVFKANAYNNFDPYDDYVFMLNMFNKRELTDKQLRKTSAIILGTIKPNLEKMLQSKVKVNEIVPK